jgi:hypothetical protein
MTGEAKRHPRDLALWTEQNAVLPDSSWERFRGYGIMGLPFDSGHVLALRRFAASSLGPGYASVWHRTPTGRWTFYADVEPAVSCARYFSVAVAEAIKTEVVVEWTGAHQLVVSVPAAPLEWTVDLETTWRSQLMNAVARVLPERLWRSPRTLTAMGGAASWLLDVGPVGLWGLASNGHRFIANPRRIWMVAASDATLRGESLGTPEPLPDQASLRDFRIPQRGIFALGDALFKYPTNGTSA